MPRGSPVLAPSEGHHEFRGHEVSIFAVLAGAESEEVT